jgi:transcriptional regulator with XRE-family HTH domain
MEFKNILISLRNEKGIDRETLAKHLNITYSSVAKYETGERTPNAEMLTKIAEFFNVSIDFLLGRTKIRIEEDDFVLPDGDRLLRRISKSPMTKEQKEAFLKSIESMLEVLEKNSKKDR